MCEKSGLLDTVLDALKAENIDYGLWAAFRQTSTLAMAKEGIELGKRKALDFIHVGGGSVIDSAKCIADGIANPDVDVWKFYERGNSKGCSSGGRYPYVICNRQ